MRDLYSDITNDIIAAIEAGVGNYVMPWHGAASIGLPQNGVTGASYHGINTMILMMKARRAGYAEPVWATYRQWQESDRQVSRGARGTCTILYKPMAPREDGSHEDEDGRRRVYIRASSLFNIAQTDGYVPPADGAA